MKRMEELKLDYAILSDFYGLHFAEDWQASYDTHPSALDAQQKQALGREIGALARARGFNVIIFYNNSPVMSRPYFEMLSQSGLDICFATRLPP